MAIQEQTSTDNAYTPARRLKLLLSSYACEPERGSEEGNGWNSAVELSRFHEVWVMVNEEYRESIETYVAKNPLPNMHFVFLDLPRWTIFWRKPKQLQRIHYYFWQHWGYFTAKRLHDEHHFDATMHLTYGSYWRPSFLRLLPVPFLWGPTGGAENIPQHFYPTLDEASIKWDRQKRLVEGAACSLDPTVRATARKATVALIPTHTTEAKVRELGSKRTYLVPQNALPLHELEKFAEFPIRRDASPVRFISMGRILGWKGIHLGLRAFAKMLERYPDAEYWHDGGGELAGDLKALAQELGVTDKFRLFEKNNRQQALENLAQCDVLVFPCLHDEPGWVCLEAMAAGRPAIYLLGRPQIPGAEEIGFTARSNSVDQAIDDMAESMYKLASDPDLRQQMGEAARAKAWRYFNFSARANDYARLIDEVVAQKS